MSNKLIITKNEGKILSFFLEDNEAVQINVEKEMSDHILNNIYLGKVKNIVKNIDAAFVEIADGQMCYLSLDEVKNPIFANSQSSKGIRIGDEFLVQVAKENIKTKAPVVTTNIGLTGKYSVLTHGKTTLGISNKIVDEEKKKAFRKFLSQYKGQPFGIIIRTNAEQAPLEVIEREIAQLVEQYMNLVQFGIHKARFSLLYKAPANYLCDIRDEYEDSMEEIITDDEQLYEEMKEFLSHYPEEERKKLTFYQDSMISLNNVYSIQSKLQKAMQERVWLKSGGYLVIQPTEALTVIDVNTGKAIAGKKKAEETFYKVNMEASKEIAKQLRLRNLSGIIIIDYIDMREEAHKDELLENLRELLSKDRIRTTVVDMTALNLVEVTRKKVRKPLHEQMNE